MHLDFIPKSLQVPAQLKTMGTRWDILFSMAAFIFRSLCKERVNPQEKKDVVTHPLKQGEHSVGTEASQATTHESSFTFKVRH
jgi:hypothetical protein